MPLLLWKHGSRDVLCSAAVTALLQARAVTAHLFVVPALQSASVLSLTTSCRHVAGTQQPGRHIRRGASRCLQHTDNIGQECSGMGITQGGKITLCNVAARLWSGLGLWLVPGL